VAGLTWNRRCADPGFEVGLLAAHRLVVIERRIDPKRRTGPADRHLPIRPDIIHKPSPTGIRFAERNGTRRPWLVQLMARRTTKVAAVALANKTARMVWALMTGGEHYRDPLYLGR